MKKKTIVKYLLFLIFPLLLMSCKDNDLEPEESPIYLTKEAQSKSIRVGNMWSIASDEFDHEIGYEGRWSWLINDWITCTKGHSNELFITVTENTSKSERRFLLTIRAQSLDKIQLEIIQAGE